MPKLLIGLGVIVIVIIAGWFLLKNDTVNYVAEVNGEVMALESELAEIETAVQAGLLTPEEAAEAQIKIVARIDAISAAATAGQKAQLSDAQRAQLVEGLERLKQTLIKYQSTLTTVDEIVLELPESERPKLSSRGGGGENAVSAIALETIGEVEEQIEDVIEEVTDEELADELTDSTSETYVPEDEVSTSTEENGSVEGSPSETEIYGGTDISTNPDDETIEEVSGDEDNTSSDDTSMEENTAGN